MPEKASKRQKTKQKGVVVGETFWGRNRARTTDNVGTMRGSQQEGPERAREAKNDVRVHARHKRSTRDKFIMLQLRRRGHRVFCVNYMGMIPSTNKLLGQSDCVIHH
jgi:hypothetical protein